MRNLEPILLVDERPDDARALGQALAELDVPNHVLHCADCEAALGRLRGVDGAGPCLVLINASMPGNRGLDILRAIKSDEQTRHIPVVTLVDCRSDPAVEDSFYLGAAGCLVKASTHEELLETLRTVCRYWSLSEMVTSERRSR